MATPQDREEFISYCLRKLGEPVIRVNVATEQLEDRVTEALYKFYDRHYDAVEDVFLVYNITEDDVDRGHIILPKDFIGVTAVFKPQAIASGYAIEYQQFINELYSNQGIFQTGGISYFYMQKMNLTLLDRFFNPDRQYDYNKITNKLIIAGGLRNLYNISGMLVIRGFRRILGDSQDYEDNVSNLEFHNIWKNKWLQDYATALIKKQWAQNMSKFQNIQMLGGVSLNGEQLMAQAEAEIEKLEEQLQLEFELPPIGFLA